MANIYSLKSGLASDPTVWSGGVVPTASDRVLIMASHVVELDGTYEWGGDSTATITINGVSTTRAINIAGTLKHSRTVSSQLTCVGNIYVLAGGWHDMGTEADPILLPVTTTLVLNKSAAMAANKYGYETAVAARFTAWGSPKLRTAHLTAAAGAGATSIQVDVATGWLPGDEIAVSQTDLSGPSRQGYGVIAAGYVSGDLTIPLVSALSFNHAAGAVVGNGTNNLTVKSFNVSLPSSAFHLFSGQTDAAGSRELGHITFDSLGGIYPAYGFSVRSNTNYSSTPWAQAYRVCKGITIYKRNLLGSPNVVQFGENVPAATPIPYEDTLIIGAMLTDENSALAVSGAHCRQVRTTFLNATYQMTGTTDVYLEDCTLVGRRRDCLQANGALSLDFVRLKVGGYRMGSYGVIAHANGLAVANDVTYLDCDFGVTYPLPADSALFYFQTLNSRLVATLRDCVFGATVVEPDVGTMGNLTAESVVKVINRNKDVLQQAEYRRQGVYRRDNAVKFRGSSSISLRPNLVGLACSRAQAIPCGNGKSVRVVGYLKMDTAYLNSGNCNAPTVTLSGLGATPEVFTAALNTDWQKFDLSATNGSGFDGNFSLTTSATPKAVATGTIYLDGVPDSPFVTKVRHFGFTFDESSPIRTINPVVQVSEAVAAAYTGVTITPADPSIVIGAGTVDSWRKLYDHYQAWACLNVAEESLLASVDGITFSLPLSCKLSWTGMPSVGTLSGGWLQLGVPGAHTYGLSGTKVDFTAPGTYNLSGSRVAGTLDLVNSSGGAVTVSLPAGADYVISSGSITVTPPQISLTLEGFPAGADIVILEAGTSTILEQVDQAAGPTYVYSYSTPVLVDIGIIKPGYKPRYLRNLQLATADANLPVSLDIDRSYLP